MSEKHVVIATFTMPMEAHIACGQLQAEGIPAYLTGEEASSVFGGVAGLGGRVELYVPVSAYDRAVEILRTHLEEPHATANQERRRESDIESNLWLCSLCGDAVSVEVMVCPACGTSREALKPAARDEPHETRPSSRPPSRDVKTKRPRSGPTLEMDLELPPLATYQGDDLASRAMKSALLSLLFLPLCLLSFAQIVQLMLYQGEFTTRGTRNMYIALVVNVLLVLALLTICISCGARF